ncbi:hypothetical protein M501DRAFT_764739 [Patellaria atrata CBS 101060]|uniref:Uncharacterized protein n=1 Tax=Patellaria atrata CBS 101060 TaxID=1346257 RepID=A0A9P4SCL8_9PEZI|nr:hypothetical protein M501DRAFT_764739 [Patellaria atrata CBS 101060]
MPVGIAQVVNNTSSTLYYHNTESGHNDTVYAKSRDQENNSYIPSSNTTDDTLPYASSGHYLKLTVGGYAPIKISDDDWKFKIVAPVDYGGGGGESEAWYGSLDNGSRYIIRVDEVKDEYNKYCSVTILKYQDRCEVTAGYIALQVIQQAAPIVAMVLLAIFI